MFRKTNLGLLEGITRWISEGIRANENRKVSNTRTATRFHVYASFGIEILRREFSSDAACRDFIEEYLPECLSNWKTLLKIARHFKYDETYLRFLARHAYSVPPQKRAEATKVAVQLPELARKYGHLDTPEQLEDLFESGRLIGETTAAKDKPEGGGSTDASENPAETGEAVSGTETDTTTPPTPPMPSAADINFNKQLQSLVFSVSNYSRVEAAFHDLLRLRPASHWDAIRARNLKEALQKAESISGGLANLIP
jgi:hypothetical protein